MTENTGQNTDEIPDGAARILPWQEAFYKDLHANPELSFQESRTAALAAAKLKECGYEVIEGLGGTGVVGIFWNGEGKTVLARADMDALPMRENTGLPYASKASAVDANGNTVAVSHSCGHDVHVTCLLGAAELLAASRSSWSGTFIALFQPAEEVGGGAKGMVDDGLIERIPKPDVAFAQHVLAYPAGRIEPIPVRYFPPATASASHFTARALTVLCRITGSIPSCWRRWSCFGCRRSCRARQSPANLRC